MFFLLQVPTTYEVFLKIIKVIILTVASTIDPLDDKTKWHCRYDIIALFLNWTCIGKQIGYLMANIQSKLFLVIGSLKVLFDFLFHFLAANFIKLKSEFCCQWVFMNIDDFYLIWDWRNFQKEWKISSHLKLEKKFPGIYKLKHTSILILKR